MDGVKEPSDDLKPDPDTAVEVPDLDALTSPDELVRGERTRDDFFDAVLGLDEPATVEAVADLAGHGPDAAREYLRWFERIGVVERVRESPATYRRNDEYLAWRRVQRLRREYDPDELAGFLATESERDEEFADEFGVASPDGVRVTAAASATDRSVEETWRRLSAWRTTRRRIALLERALASTEESAPGRGRVA